MTGFDELFGTGTSGPRQKPKSALRVVDEDAVDNSAAQAREQEREQAKLAAAQDAAVKAAADAYMALLPEIKAARPQPPTYEATQQLTGEAWVHQQWRDALSANPAAFGIESTVEVGLHSHGGAVIVTVIVPEHLAGQGRASIAESMIAEATRRQNLGVYAAHPHPTEKRKFFLIRENATDTTSGWREHPKTAAFYRSATTGGTYHQQVLDLAGLVLRDPKTGQAKYPQREFRTGDRGGECVLTLPPGMLPKHAVAAQDGLRAALAMPALTIDEGDGLRPVIRLNSKAIVRAFPKQNPLDASRMYLPRTEAERYACSAEVRLFLGVTETGDVVAPRLADRSHAAIYGMTNSGKSTLMTIIARSLAAQGCEVWLADAKGTPEFRQLYLDRVPGITHLSVATPAAMHATIHKLLELYRFRRDVGDELVQRGVTDIRWTRVVLIWDEMGAFLNSALSDGADPVARKHAEYTVNWLAEVAAKSRAYGVHLLVAGQHVYSAALPSKLRENLSIRVVLGRASDVHIQRLFEEDVRDAAKAAREGIEPGMRGRGIVQADDGGVVQMQAFYNNAEQAASFDRATAGTSRLLRWGHRFPIADDAPGGMGAWQQWGGWEGDAKNELAGTVEDLGTVVLDRRDPVTREVEPDPGSAVWDIASPSYRPGSPPRSKAFQNVN
ncbi:FtsK/SpoIIIE domain-containing protein [Mycobacteroides abscessus]|uniref:FtsK/SpoIIIE domain-containing protein n=1 Tax=Mycobacteroides abscessus TaxID=36809 RepID=UPI00092720B0|nr:FtsK/SpoIIIE domain-containing protein [Mycobacteroides abscessus]SIH16874.1 ftsk/SpoIIIE family protein, putative [Mycobacteroides abscessus subsp. abscessus]